VLMGGVLWVERLVTGDDLDGRGARGD